MVIIPKEKPSIENLNSYYLNVPRLLEHYQGELAAGGLYFKSISSEGAVFFDNNTILGTIYDDGESFFEGDAAFHRLFSDCQDKNFTISAYEIDPARVYYWSNIASAQRIYDNLSSEFTDLQGLLKKMGQEKLTGYIEVNLAIDGQKQAWIFFLNGMILGAIDSWQQSNLDRSGEYLKKIITQTKNAGGTFNVCKVQMQKPHQPIMEPDDILDDLEQLLVAFDELVKSSNGGQKSFERDLKSKMVDYAEHFAFLDPIAGEFTYRDHRLVYEGEASHKELVEGTLSCILDLAHERGILDDFKDNITIFLRKHGQGAKLPGFTS